jgi:endoglucanase
MFSRLILVSTCLCLLAGLVGCSGDPAAPQNGAASHQQVGIAGNSFTLDGARWIPKAFNIAGFVSTPAYLAQLPSKAKFDGYRADSQCTQQLYDAVGNYGADTVRIFVSQYFLSSASEGDPYYDPNYRSSVVSIVQQARANGLVVEIAMQEEEEGGGPVFHGLPTPQTLENWLWLNQYFGSDQGVMYELYNEPSQGPDPHGPPPATDWQLWLEGGATAKVPSTGATFTAVGMQDLVTALRSAGSQNTLVLDGLALATTINGVPAVSDPLGRVAYGIHQYLKGGKVARPDWDANFGDQSDVLPIFVDEWFACANTVPGLEGLDTYEPAVEFLNYLREKGIGIGGWAIDTQGYMVNDVPDPSSAQGCAGWQQPSYYAGYSASPPMPLGDAGMLIINAFLTDYGRALTLADGTTLYDPPPSTYPPTPPYPTPSYPAIDCST